MDKLATSTLYDTTEQEHPEQVTILLAGNENAGKTSLAYRYLSGTFHEPYILYSMMLEHQHEKEIVMDGIPISLHVIDMPHQDRWNIRLRLTSDPCSDIFLLGVSIKSIHHMRKILPLFCEEMKSCGKNGPIILFGMQTDRKHEAGLDRALMYQLVTPQEGYNFVREFDLLDYFECSARSNEGVEEVFSAATRYALKRKYDKLNTGSRNNKKCIVS